MKLCHVLFGKRWCKRKTYQTKFNVNKYKKLNKNKVAPSSLTSTSETGQTSETHQGVLE